MRLSDRGGENYMWLVFAILSAVFAGLTSILAKCGIRNTDSDVATMLRTVIVLAFAWIMAAISGGVSSIGDLDIKTVVFLVLSGLATGASWLCYFKALQLGDVNKVVPVDKASVALTMIFAFVFLGEFSAAKLVLMLVLLFGTLLMVYQGKGNETAVQNVKSENKSGKKWLLFAVLSAVFAALASILAKVGIVSVNSDLGTAVRTTVVLVMSVIVVAVQGKFGEIKKIEKKELSFLVLSGLATGASWLCYYRALQTGDVSVVVPVDKLSILITVAFSYFFLKEKLSKRAALGLLLITASTLGLIYFG